MDFREYLQKELIRRTQVNPQYSLRAFARSLEVQSGFLSKILLAQRRVTIKTIQRFGVKLGLSPLEMSHFEKLAKNKSLNKLNRKEVQLIEPYQKIALDQFQFISDWYHFAILEVMNLSFFKPNIRWIANMIGISNAEAFDAIERLKRLGLIIQNKSGSWKVSGNNTTTLGTELTNSALRKMQKQILEKAIIALEEIPADQRDQSTMTMAIDSSLIPIAKVKIKRFRRQLCSFLESGQKKDLVYNLSIVLYPVSKKQRSRSKQ